MNARLDLGLLAVAGLVLVACSDSSPAAISSQSPATAAAGQTGSSVGAGSLASCGYTFCPPGQICCNATCGLCAAPGESCPQRTCIGAPPGTAVYCLGGDPTLGCPGAGSCEPRDRTACDPQRGDRRCPGVCQCNAPASCVSGFVWNPEPSICACYPAD